MDLSIYDRDFTQHDLFGLLKGARGGRALRDSYGRAYLITIARRGGQTTLKRYGRDYLRELASRGGKAKRYRLFKTCRTTNPGLPHQKALDEFSLFSAKLTANRF
jgi:hypothetical protein